MAWTAPATAIAGSVLTAAWLNTYLRDNMLALQGGTIAVTKITLDGAASDPGASPVGDGVIAYNTTQGELRMSLNGGSYERLGAPFAYNDPLLVGGTVFGFRY